MSKTIFEIKIGQNFDRFSTTLPKSWTFLHIKGNNNTREISIFVLIDKTEEHCHQQFCSCVTGQTVPDSATLYLGFIHNRHIFAMKTNQEV